MPSLVHEALLILLRAQPTLAVTLVRDLLGVPVPDHSEVEVIEPDFTQLLPTEFRADLVVRVGDPPSLGLIVEHQRRADAAKRFSWPLYAAALHARLRCQVCLLVVTASEQVAAWASRPVQTVQPGSPFVPLVLGPAGIPRIAEAERARAYPELAVLAALAHGNDPAGLEVVLAAIEAVAGLEGERAILYYDLILGTLNQATRSALEAEMHTRDYQFQSDFARRYFEQGRLELARSALGRTVAQRLGEIPPDIAARVAACDDVEVLMDWLTSVVAADDAAGVRAAIVSPGE